ncbi:MAG: TraM recognition domain-containing protein [Telluria sp.]
MTTKNVIACCGARVVYAPNDNDFAADISRELGTFTTKNKSGFQLCVSQEAARH